MPEQHYFQVCYPEDTVASVLSAYRAGAGFEGMYEYEPPGGDDSSIATGLPDACLVSDPSIVLGKPDPDDPDANPSGPRSGQLPGHFHLRSTASKPIPSTAASRAAIPHPGYLVLRLLSYPAWRCASTAKC